MTPQCVMLTRLFLLIAVPLTVVWWGGFWVVRRHWHAVAWVQGERRRFRWLILWSAIVLAELAVLVCVAAGATPALAGSVRCTTYEEKSLGRLRTLCSDGARRPPLQ